MGCESVRRYCWLLQILVTASAASWGPAVPLLPHGPDANFLTLSFLFLLLKRGDVLFFLKTCLSAVSLKFSTLGDFYQNDYLYSKAQMMATWPPSWAEASEQGFGSDWGKPHRAWTWKTTVQAAVEACGGHWPKGASSRVAICLWLSLSTSQGVSQICFFLIDPNQSPVSHIRNKELCIVVSLVEFLSFTYLFVYSLFSLPPH